MSVTYLDVCNEVLADLNDILLTSSTFTSAVNIQLHVKNVVNKAYYDLNNPEFKWPWLATAAPTDGYLGNTYVEVSPGTQFYLLKTGSTGINDDYGAINWKSFSLTTEGTSGAVAPYIVKKLHYLSLEEWQEGYSVKEAKEKAEAGTGGIPTRIFPSPDNRRFGISPIPDTTYRVYFYAWDRPTRLVNYNDVLELPDQYSSVLVSRARYYAWQRKENPQQAAIALQEYEAGLDGMVEQTTNSSPDYFRDTRI